jgi:hypothetical protein
LGTRASQFNEDCELPVARRSFSGSRLGFGMRPRSSAGPAAVGRPGLSCRRQTYRSA